MRKLAPYQRVVRFVTHNGDNEVAGDMSPARGSRHQHLDVRFVFVIRHRLVTDAPDHIFFGGEGKDGLVGSANVGNGVVLNPEKVFQRIPKP